MSRYYANTKRQFMNYTINQLAEISKVSVRTLHHYDAIGLLSPKRNPKNNYRVYDEDDLLALQQILFFRELDFPLEDITNIVTSKNFDIMHALKDHRKMIHLKKKKIDELLLTIDKTVNKINKTHMMKDEELYEGFSKEELEVWNKEARERWGNTSQYKESEDKVKKMGTDGLKKALSEHGEIAVRISVCMNEGKGHQDDIVQELIQEHFDWLRNFYEPTLEIYQGLAEMYVQDKRFKATYEQISPGLAQYMHDAMCIYVKNNPQRNG